MSDSDHSLHLVTESDRDSVYSIIKGNYRPEM